MSPIRDAYEKSVPAKGYRPELKVVKASFLNQAGLIGAADLARQAFA
jgi:glucokinase